MREASSWLKIPNTPHSSLNLSIILGFLGTKLYCIVIGSGESIHKVTSALVKSQKFANLLDVIPRSPIGPSRPAVAQAARLRCDSRKRTALRHSSADGGRSSPWLI